MTTHYILKNISLITSSPEFIYFSVILFENIQKFLKSFESFAFCGVQEKF